MVFSSLFDYLKSLDFWAIFSLGLGAATIVLVVLYFIIFSNYRSRKLKTHQIKIDLNGGIFQGSNEELIIKAKLGAEVDLTRIRPVKEGYRFNGFNVYKQFISSTIKEEGLTKSSVTKEELDGIDKTIVVMPNYDLTFVAQYSPLSNTLTRGLVEEKYYPDFLSFDDLVADLKHLNDDKDNWPVELKFKRSPLVPNMVFVFKKDTICAMLMPYKTVSKVFFRTSEPTDSMLLTPFYQTEDINDAMNWYSMVVIYSTKPSRFIHSFKTIYDGIDETSPTTQIEFNLIISSLSNLADPILDRAVLIVDRFEKDKLLAPVPEYVIKRELPPDLDENGEPKRTLSVIEEKSLNEQPSAPETKEEKAIKEEPPVVESAPAEEIKPIKEAPKEPEPVKEPEEKKEEIKPVIVKPVIQEEPVKKVAEPKPIKPVTPIVVEPKPEPKPVEEPEEKKIIIKPLENKPISTSDTMPSIKPVQPRLVHVNPSDDVKPQKPSETPKPLSFKPKSKKPIKPDGPIDIKHVNADSAVQLSASGKSYNEAKPTTPPPSFVNEAPIKKKKPKRKPVVAKKEVDQSISMPSISGERRVPNSNKPRKRNVPLKRQVTKPKKKHNR